MVDQSAKTSLPQARTRRNQFPCVAQADAGRESITDDTRVVFENVNDRRNEIVDLGLIFTRNEPIDIIDTSEFRDDHGQPVSSIVVQVFHDAFSRVLVDMNVCDHGLDVDTVHEGFQPSRFGGLF